MEKEWARFFTLAGIPDGTAIKYATNFSANRVKKEQLGDLDKEYLSDLGVNAIGDQIAILKRARAVVAMEKAGAGAKKSGGASSSSTSSSSSSSTPRQPISAPTTLDTRFTTLDERCASVQRRGKPPPDRHEIYHVKMPAGTTAKSRKIMQNLEALKRSGLHSRGTSGVRQAGQSVLSIAEQRERETEVSSTTGRAFHRLGGVRGVGGRVIKRRVVSGTIGGGGLFGSAMAVAGNPAVRKMPLRVEKEEGGKGRLPSVTVRLGNRLRVSGAEQGVGGGRVFAEKVVVAGGKGRAGRGLTRRVQEGGRSAAAAPLIVDYVDEMEEVYDDDEEEEGIEYEEEEEEEEEMEEEYEDEMEEESSTVVVGRPPGAARLDNNSVRTRYVPVMQPTSRRNHALANARRGAPPVVKKPSIFDRIAF